MTSNDLRQMNSNKTFNNSLLFFFYNSEEINGETKRR